MRLIDADSVLKGIDELKQSPWFNRGKEVVESDPGFQHIGYLERKEAVEVVRDLCIRQEPTVGGWISVNDRLPEKKGDYLIFNTDGIVWPYWYDKEYKEWYDSSGYLTENVTHWMPLPEPPEEVR